MTRLVGDFCMIGVADAHPGGAAEDSLLVPIPDSVCPPLLVETRGLERRLADLFAASANLCS
jgi:hypothetical protein